MKTAIKLWLYSCLLLIFIIVIVGGITRLTGSGLSMVDWHPVYGILPPLNHDQWMDVFNQYKQFPEYQHINKGMDLEAFKGIFFWEYFHRILGRIIGLVILVPYLFFLATKQLNPLLKRRGFWMVVLVVAQGVMGWYMVKSGLVNVPAVSHFRLAAHLGLAFFLFQYILWTLLDLNPKEEPNFPLLRKSAYYLTVLLSLQILYGAFVAGLDAGWGYNTFPKMGEHWIPPGLMALDGFFHNLFDNRTTVQFIHRLLAFFLVIEVLTFAWLSSRYDISDNQHLAIYMVIILLGVQFVLGVMTLIYMVPMPLAVAHQAVALLLLSAVTILNYRLKK